MCIQSKSNSNNLSYKDILLFCEFLYVKHTFFFLANKTFISNHTNTAGNTNKENKKNHKRNQYTEKESQGGALNRRTKESGEQVTQFM